MKNFFKFTLMFTCCCVLVIGYSLLKERPRKVEQGKEVLPASIVEEEKLDDLKEELSIEWRDKDLSQSLYQNIRNCISNFQKQKYHVSFLLYDLKSGVTISYHPNELYYSASVVKAPYITSLLEEKVISFEEEADYIKPLLRQSSNEAFRHLWETYGSSAYKKWVTKAGCKNFNAEKAYTDINSLNLANMWIRIYQYVSKDTADAKAVKELLEHTKNSFISTSLGNTYTVYSKAGWIHEDDYYLAQHDAGIVIRKDGTYVLVVLSDAFQESDMLQQLTKILDDTYTKLI